MNNPELWNDILEQSGHKTKIMNDAQNQFTNYVFNRPILGKILILPRNHAQLFQYNKPWSCISISELAVPDPPIQAENRIGLLRLRFDDIEFKRSEYKMISPAQAKWTWEFVDKIWKESELLMIHCAAGISRSPAMGKAISEKYQPEFAEYFDQLYSPNGLVYKLMRETCL